MSPSTAMNGSENAAERDTDGGKSRSVTADRPKTQGRPERTQMTPYDRLTNDISKDKRFLNEITLGRRIGFYRIRGELGSGNFSQVKLGVHALTKGELAQ